MDHTMEETKRREESVRTANGLVLEPKSGRFPACADVREHLESGSKFARCDCTRASKQTEIGKGGKENDQNVTTGVVHGMRMLHGSDLTMGLHGPSAQSVIGSARLGTSTMAALMALYGVDPELLKEFIMNPDIGKEEKKRISRKIEDFGAQLVPDALRKLNTALAKSMRGENDMLDPSAVLGPSVPSPAYDMIPEVQVNAAVSIDEPQQGQTVQPLQSYPADTPDQTQRLSGPVEIWMLTHDGGKVIWVSATMDTGANRSMMLESKARRLGWTRISVQESETQPEVRLMGGRIVTPLGLFEVKLRFQGENRWVEEGFLVVSDDDLPDEWNDYIVFCESFCRIHDLLRRGPRA